MDAVGHHPACEPEPGRRFLGLCREPLRALQEIDGGARVWRTLAGGERWVMRLVFGGTVIILVGVTKAGLGRMCRFVVVLGALAALIASQCDLASARPVEVQLAERAGGYLFLYI